MDGLIDLHIVVDPGSVLDPEWFPTDCTVFASEQEVNEALFEATGYNDYEDLCLARDRYDSIRPWEELEAHWREKHTEEEYFDLVDRYDRHLDDVRYYIVHVDATRFRRL